MLWYAWLTILHYVKLSHQVCVSVISTLCLMCILVNIATQVLHSVTWRRINITALEFTCEIACKTPLISGCVVVLCGGGGQSTAITGMAEAIAPRYVSVVITNLNLLCSYSFSASALVIVNRTFINTNIVRGRILPAACKNIDIIFNM